VPTFDRWKNLPAFMQNQRELLTRFGRITPPEE
jgi:hypothetical protein